LPGDNPSYNYYLVGDTGVYVGLLSLFSWNYPCGECHKLRIQPTGQASVCINFKELPSLIGRDLETKTEILRKLIDFRENGIEEAIPYRKHYRAQLGELRFGKLGEPVPMEHFYKLIKDS
jgi:cyclic pyranopterin phosphate synthase